jgi:hypothetical protein
VVDRSNTDQEIKAIRGTDSISRRPDLSSAFRYELVISGTIAEYNQTPDRRVVDRSNTDQEIKAIRGTDSISRRPDLSSAFRYELVISGTIGEYNQTPDRRVIDRSNTDQEIKAISRHQLQKCSKHFVCCPRIIDERE